MQSQLADSSLAKTTTNVTENINKKVKRSLFRSKRRAVRYGLLASNLVLVALIVGFIITTRNSETTGVPLLNLTSDKEITDPLDELSGADIAVNVALMTGLPQTTAVVNHADSASVQDELVQSGSQSVAKPQILTTDLKSKNDIKTYVVAEGDTVDSLSQKFGVSASSIKWSNSLSSNELEVGKELTIPPVDGVIYTVKDGDTAAALARAYSSDESRIIAFNDAEIDGLVVGEQILIPDGQKPTPVAARVVGAATGFRFGSSPVYGYNGYDYGYCTWYAANRRAAVGKPIPANLGNASTWKIRSQYAGIATGSAPQAHAVIWTPPRDYYGHVGFVEEVYPDGSVLVSEMNTRGWGVMSTKVLTPAQAAGYQYIY